VSARHHPSAETLARYAADTLDAGPAAVVDVHVASCRLCQAHVLDYEALAGAELEAVAPADLVPGALDMTLSCIEIGKSSRSAPSKAPRKRQPKATDRGLPQALDNYDLGKWLWLGPGLRWASVRVPGAAKANVMLMKIGPNKSMPEHGHTGCEYTQIISGSYFDGINRYGPGDFSEADHDVEHQPVVDPGEDCICLAAVEGKMRFKGLLGRVLQPFY
jgi:putative transcriptional regulator